MGREESALTETSLNVYEASFLSEKRVCVLGGCEGDARPEIYLMDAMHDKAFRSILVNPAILRSLRMDSWMIVQPVRWRRDGICGSVTRRPGRRGVSPMCRATRFSLTWEENSKTVLYSTDCGRSLWFTAIARRRVIP